MTARKSTGRPSAGILLYRFRDGAPEVLLGHPGGAFWARKDAGAWTIPKGEAAPDEDLLACALREFEEETGHRPGGKPEPLGEAVQRSRKVVVVFALAGDFDLADLRSNLCEIAWPPRSGHLLSFPELDRAAWLTLPAAREKILPGQAVFLDRLADLLSAPAG